MQIKEPEGFEEKRAKKRDRSSGAEVAAKRPRSGPDATTVITDYFKGTPRLVGTEGSAPATASGTSQGQQSHEMAHYFVYKLCDASSTFSLIVLLPSQIATNEQLSCS